ncbi:hypothetical protein MDAP_000490 [Mitosporidium daphniae]
MASRGIQLLLTALPMMIGFFVIWTVNPERVKYLICAYAIAFFCYLSLMLGIKVNRSMKAKNPKAVEMLLKDVQRAKAFFKQKQIIE